MKELNLEVGQKCWSIQLGDCSVIIAQEESPQNGSPYKYIVRSINSGEENVYRYDFKKKEEDFYQSLFESNPFEKGIQVTPGRGHFKDSLNYFNQYFQGNEIDENDIYPKTSKGEWVYQNKSELINALYNILTLKANMDLRIIAEQKLKKLLESI